MSWLEMFKRESERVNAGIKARTQPQARKQV